MASAKVNAIVDELLEGKKIPAGYTHNFDMLTQAIKAGDVALIMAVDKKTGQDVAVVCAVNHEGGDVGLVPVAKLFTGNPYEELEDPTQEDLPRGKSPSSEDFA